MVLMNGDILVGKNHSEALGFDAISSYGLGGGGTVEVQRSKPIPFGVMSGANQFCY